MTEQEHKHCFPDSLDAYTDTKSEYKTEKLKVYTNAIDSFDVAEKHTLVKQGTVSIDGHGIFFVNPTLEKIAFIICGIAAICGAIYGYKEHDSSILWAIFWLYGASLPFCFILWLMGFTYNVIYKLTKGYYFRKEYTLRDTITIFNDYEVWDAFNDYKDNYLTEDGRKYLLGKYNPYQLHYLKLRTIEANKNQETSEEKRAREEREKLIEKGEKKLNKIDVDEKELFF